MRKARTSYVRGVLFVYVQVYLCGACIGICVRTVPFMCAQCYLCKYCAIYVHNEFFSTRSAFYASNRKISGIYVCVLCFSLTYFSSMFTVKSS